MSTERLPVIYIAGPYRAATPWKILQNIRQAQAVALQVWKLGAVALCPHANTALFDGEAADDIWLEGDLELLRRCDAIVLTEDFEQSSGARAEFAFARKELKIQAFILPREQDVLKEWIRGWKNDRRSEPRPKYDLDKVGSIFDE